jgi:hypothetical protein
MRNPGVTGAAAAHDIRRPARSPALVETAGRLNLTRIGNEPTLARWRADSR